MKKGELIAPMPVEITRFSGRGTVVTFTIITSADYAPEGFAYLAPYAVAEIRLEEGPLVAARLTDVDLAEIKIGMKVEMVMRKGRDLGERSFLTYGYAFRPPIPESTETLAETIARIMAEPEMVYKIGHGLVPKGRLAETDS